MLANCLIVQLLWQQVVQEMAKTKWLLTKDVLKFGVGQQVNHLYFLKKILIF